MQSNRSRTARRIALTAAALTLAVAGSAAVAQAATHPATHQEAHGAASAQVVGSGGPQSATGRVADFYGAYIDAVWDTQNDHLAKDLRAHYLTPALQKRLAAWEARNHADGVLKAQDVPTAWRVTYQGSGAGHAYTTVRLTWGGAPGHATYTTIQVQSDLATRKISDIK